MTQIAPPAGALSHPAYAQIADRLDAIGQKYRVQQILRGVLLWIGLGTLVTLAVVVAAHFAGAGLGSRLLLVAWALTIAGSGIVWIGRPLLFRPDPVEIARLIEQRVEGLHNGLTNSLLLARQRDLDPTGWLPHIYDEILASSQSAPLGRAVRWSDLRALSVRVAAALGLALIALLFFRPMLAQGWQQLFNPSAFVPREGSAHLIDVEPGDARVITGQSLDVTVIARVPRGLGQPAMNVLFAPAGADAKGVPSDVKGDPSGGKPDPSAEAIAMPAGGRVLPGSVADVDGDPSKADLRYSYHVDHLGRGVRYRVEVAGTQSRWYSVDVIRKVELTDLAFRVTAPTYVAQPVRQTRIKAPDLARTPLVVAQASVVEIEATIDVPVGGAMLQAGDAAAPIPMTASPEGRRFTGQLTILRDTPISVLLTDRSGQVMFKAPADPFLIACARDNPPVIQMKWPAQDQVISPASQVKIVAELSDDYGLASARVLWAPANDPAGSAGAAGGPGLKQATAMGWAPGTKQGELAFVLPLSAEQRHHGSAIRVQVEATDNRDLGPAARAAYAAELQAQGKPAPDDKALDGLVGPQTSRSAVFQIRFQDPAQIAREQKENGDALRRLLRQMLDTQKSLYAQTTSAGLGDRSAFQQLGAGQSALRDLMKSTAETFPFEPDDRVVQKALLILAYEPGKEAIDLCNLLLSELDAPARRKEDDELQARQRRVIDVLQSLLAAIAPVAEPTTLPTTRRGGDLLSKAEALKKLDDALKQYMKEQQRILDQTANLAKKPVDNFDDADKKKLEDLAMAQEKLDAFMQEKIHDFSKLAEQDMSNSSALKDLYQMYSEVTMAKDALKKKATETAVAAEDMGLEMAKEQSSNIEKWLANSPDRTSWTQEDPVDKKDIPMPELPKELEDMIGKLQEQEEDLFDQMEDQNANWTDSADKGIGWDAADGPIADMSAKGVTGNQLPNNNEMGGRSGEGRSAKSQGEMVDDTATGKGGRRTPTRLDPTPFQKGQVNDTSKDPTGGATGGGKLSGQGGQGLEGPVGPKLKQQMQRLAEKQAQLRNQAERLNLKYQLGRYDNFKLTEATAVMRRVESDLNANRYHNAMHRKDLLIDSLDTSRLLLGSRVDVQQDTTPTASDKVRREIDDARAGELPPAWSDALKAYYKKLSEQ